MLDLELMYTQRDRKHGKSEAWAGNIDHSRANIRITRFQKLLNDKSNEKFCVGKIAVEQSLFDTRF